MMALQEGHRERRSTAKGEEEDKKFGLLDWGCFGGGSLLFFTPG